MEHWKLISRDEFDPAKLEDFAFMTITGNHWRAAITRAITVESSFKEHFKTVAVIPMFLNKVQAHHVGARENEAADLHRSRSWWDEVRHFRKEWENVGRKPRPMIDWQKRVLYEYGCNPELWRTYQYVQSNCVHVCYD